MHITMDKITDRIIEVDHKTFTEITLGEEIIGRHKIAEVSRIIEVDVGTIIETIIEKIIKTIIETITEMITEISTETIMEMTVEMTILEEVEVGLEEDDPQVMSERKTEAVVDQS